MSPDKGLLVSVIIPFRNRVEWTIQAVNSVLKQTFQNFEIILVDDGSTESIEPLSAIRDPRINIIRQTNLGPASARNNGLRHANGELIAFLDSDDLFLPEKLTIQVQFHLDNPDAWMSHTSYKRFISVEEPLEIIHSGKFSGELYPKILAGCPIATPTVMIRRKVIEQGIWYEEDIRISEDIIFYSKIAHYSKIIGIDQSFSLVRITQVTHSADPSCQIIGAVNILNYIFQKKPDLTLSEKKSLISSIFYTISQNYYYLRKPFHSIYYLFLSLINYPLFQKPVSGINYPNPFYKPRKILSKIKHSILRY